MTYPLVETWGCTFIYLLNVILLVTSLFVATYLYVANQSKCVSGILFLSSCKVIQHYAKSCNITQNHATLRKVMQRHTRLCKVTSSCKVSHTPAWLTLLSCRDVLPAFRLFQAVGERWLSTTGGLQNLSWSFLSWFFWKQFLFAGHFQNLIFYSFTQVINVKGRGLWIQIETIWR